MNKTIHTCQRLSLWFLLNLVKKNQEHEFFVNSQTILKAITRRDQCSAVHPENCLASDFNHFFYRHLTSASWVRSHFGWFTRLPDTDAQHSKFSRSPLPFAILDCNRKWRKKKNSRVVQTFSSLRRCCCCFQRRKSVLRRDRSGNNNSRTKQHATKRKLYFLSKLIWLEVTKPCPIQHVTITKCTDRSIGENWSRIEIIFSCRWSIWLHCRMLAQSLGVSDVTRLE